MNDRSPRRRRASFLAGLLVSALLLACSGSGEGSGGSATDPGPATPDAGGADPGAGMADATPDLGGRDPGDADAPDPGCGFAPFSVPGDPCMRCVCGQGAQPDCAPLQPGDGCVADDCCAVSARCTPCEDAAGACPASGLKCIGTVGDCDDGDPCTADLPICEEGSCSCTHPPAENGSPCKADPQACTEGDACEDGVCVQGPPANLDSKNPCVALVCIKGEVEQKLLAGSCTDDNPCTEGDRCALGQCVPEKAVDCPPLPCASATYCDPELGECAAELKAEGSGCEMENPCVLAATCQKGECVATQRKDCDDTNPCTTDACNPDGGQCEHLTFEDGAPCPGGGKCEAGKCSVNLPPSKPEIAVEPASPTPGEALACKILKGSVDPEGEPVTYAYAWLKNGKPTEHDQSSLPAGTTGACQVWTCELTPTAGGQPGLSGSAFTKVGPAQGGPAPPDIKVHSFPPSGGSFPNFASGEAFAVRLVVPANLLPYKIGLLRGILPAGKTWAAAVWADQAGQPGPKLGSSPGTVGAAGGFLQSVPLSAPVTVDGGTGGAVWVGFEAQSGSILDPAGAILYDADGTQGTNFVFGINLGACPGFFTPCWLPAKTHDAAIADWIVEIGPALDGACP